MRCIVACVLAVSAGCSSSASPAATDVKVVADAQKVPGLVDRVKSRIGHAFFLEALPEGSRTVESGHRYLMAQKDSLIEEAMRNWRPVYGGEIEFEHQGRTMRALLWSPNPDFSGGLVYALSSPGWHVFLGGGTPEPALKVVADAGKIPRLVERVSAIIGDDFVLDKLPDGARTVEDGWRHLLQQGRDVFQKRIRKWKAAHGAELKFEWEGKPQTVLLWSDTADFSGELVYAVASPHGYAWSLYMGSLKK